MESRRSRRMAIEAFFLEHVGEHFGSGTLHGRFGSAFRTRVSEINRDPNCRIRILNQTTRDARGESSFYWSEVRTGAECQVDGPTTTKPLPANESSCQEQKTLPFGVRE